MSTICKKEIRAYLTSMSGYVFIAFMLLVTGIYFTAYHMNMAYPIFGYTLSAVNFIFLIVTPILTMRALAEEQRQKTDQLLLTSPLSVTGIVVGKFLGMVAIFAIPVLIICLYPLIMRAYGDVSMPMSYTAILGFFLLGCSNIAIGLFLSSLTESPVIAAVITFGALFICYMMNSLTSILSQTAATSFMIIAVLILGVAVVIYSVVKNTFLAVIIGIVGEGVLAAIYFLKSTLLEGAIQKILSVFDLSSHFDDFTNGILDVSNVVYYLTVIGLFLFFTVQSIQKRRWS